MPSKPSLSQLAINSGKPGPKRARGRALSVGTDAIRLGRLIDALIVRMTAKHIEPRVIAATLGLDPEVVARRLERIEPARRKRYEAQSLADLASLPPGFRATQRLPADFFA